MKKILFAVLLIAFVLMGCASNPPAAPTTTPEPVVPVLDPSPAPVAEPIPQPSPAAEPIIDAAPEPTPSPTPEPVPAPTGMTAVELSAHHTQNDCWVAYHGTVYDLTEWLTKHPGGSFAISPYCGTAQEFAEAFNRKHGTSKEKKLPMVGTDMGPYTG